ncbi:xanthine dehydrogenase chaperone/MPT insertion protein [Burkholderia multivorans CGD2M]|uniref:Xanthine dehydrogenase chaperone/MPT insertion protein n=1 Tax=Burkholderia multivorans CGD2 TaxID=513052 RepID=B9BHT2_9BURK|nr:xanthine dehydrogenase chaperone/MPT insertion protein [Burkholderia multivorans CGD2]EEE15184.1 xanthine dehydrogenase chaperone/MPT insertion protein [Burkholderia multivorans CGD2M]
MLCHRAGFHGTEHYGAVHGEVVRTHRVRGRFHRSDRHWHGAGQLADAICAGDDYGRHPAHSGPGVGVARAVGIEQRARPS